MQHTSTQECQGAANAVARFLPLPAGLLAAESGGKTLRVTMK
jgi:hypothetical protein